MLKYTTRDLGVDTGSPILDKEIRQCPWTNMKPYELIWKKIL